jgi:hypothetical protein
MSFTISFGLISRIANNFFASLTRYLHFKAWITPISIGWRTEVVFGSKNINLILESVINECKEQLSKIRTTFLSFVPNRD